jgi:septal ring factor EnvC (AmiA/AmiB activator)
MAGPFRGFGQLVILKHDASYHSVIAGLGSVNVAVGDKLSQGEPIGAIANSPEAGLYFELRKNGKPVDPLGQNGQAFLQ